MEARLPQRRAGRPDAAATAQPHRRCQRTGVPGYPHGTTPPAIRDILVGGPAINTPPTVLVANAGAGEMYSGGGYTVLQCLLEDVTRRPLPDLVKTLVFDPLRMTSARYAEPLPTEAASATVHGGLVPGGWRRYPELAAAGLWCTAMDLVRFGAGIQDAVAGVTGAILPAKLAMEMVTRPGDGFGLGWSWLAAERVGGSVMAGRTRDTFAELTATISPGPVIVVMTASDRGNDVLHPLVPAIRQLAKWPDPAATTPQGGPPDPPIASSDVGDAGHMYSRNYETDTRERLQLDRQLYNWTLTKAGQAGVAFEALDATTLASLDRSQRIEFTVDSARQPTKITITGPTGPVTAKPV